MGSTQSSLTPQNLAAVAILVVVVASTWYNRANVGSKAAHATTKSTSAGRKGKKKRAAGGVPGASSASSDREKSVDVDGSHPGGLAERTLPGAIPDLAVATSPLEDAKPVKEKKRKTKKSATPTPSNASAEAPVAGASDPAPAAGGRSQAKRAPTTGTDGSWTRVESRRRVSTSGQNADAGVTTASVTEEDGSSSGVLERSGDGSTSRAQRTLAEKLLPKGRKTEVDDMLETSHYQELSRVMHITQSESEKPASGFSWGDYENVEDTRGAEADEEDDGGWGVVKSRGKAKHNHSFPSAAVVPQLKAPETLTRKQRQHAAKREAAKIAKAEGEAERLAVLAKHKRELEHIRLAEQHSRKGGRDSPRSNLSGGMTASVNEKGHLVWD